MRDTQDSIIQHTYNQSVLLTEKLSREAYVITAGTVGGAIAEAAKHPAKTICETTEMSLAAAGLTALAVGEFPLLSTAAIATGTILTGKYVFDLVNPNSVHNRERNQAFHSALDSASRSSDAHTLDLAIEELQKRTGIDSLQVVEGLFAGGAIRFGFHVPGVIERLPRGPQLDFAASAADSRSIPTSSSLFHNNTPTYEEFINFKNLNGKVYRGSFRAFEESLKLSGKAPNETAAYRTASKKNHEVKENDPLPPVQGNGEKDRRLGIYFDRFGSHLRQADQRP